MAGYGDDAGFAAWLAGNGLTLPAGSATPAVLREVGSAYVDGAYEAGLYCTSRTDTLAQERAWPRVGVVKSGVSVPDDFIPPAWVNASYRAAYLQAAKRGWAMGGSDPSRAVKRQKAGDVEREFFAADDMAATGNAAAGFNVDPLIDGWVSAWLCDPKAGAGVFFMAIGG